MVRRFLLLLLYILPATNFTFEFSKRFWKTSSF